MSQPTGNKTSSGLNENVAGLLCYVAWWVSGIVFLIIEKDSKFVRFHAVQSIAAFGAVTVVEIILSFIEVSSKSVEIVGGSEYPFC